MPESAVLKTIASPFRRYFNPRFEALTSRLDALSTQIGTSGSADGNGASAADYHLLRQAEYLAKIDVTQHNEESPAAEFGAALLSQAASAKHCRDPRYLSWWRQMENVPVSAGVSAPDWIGAYHRKVWEFAYIAELAEQAGVMNPGKSAIGFGVGTEPLPAMLASRGVDVLATDQGSDSETGGDWAETGQLMTGLEGLRRDQLISPEELSQRVRLRDVDMNAVPDDLGTFDLVWSACTIEHLGSPTRGMDFVLESCDLLRPGGIAVHTTELELTVKDETADYGHCAVFRIEDFQALAERVAAKGLEAHFNFHVTMESPEDRWVSLILHYPHAWIDQAHLKLALFESVTTSYGIVIRKPAEA